MHVAYILWVYLWSINFILEEVLFDQHMRVKECDVLETI